MFYDKKIDGMIKGVDLPDKNETSLNIIHLSAKYKLT